MDNGRVEVAQLVQEPMVDFPGYRVPFGYREIRGDRNIDLCPQPVS
jgi:hypothetical protein